MTLRHSSWTRKIDFSSFFSRLRFRRSVSTDTLKAHRIPFSVLHICTDPTLFLWRFCYLTVLHRAAESTIFSTTATPSFINRNFDSKSSLSKWATPIPTTTSRFWDEQLRLRIPLQTFKINDFDCDFCIVSNHAILLYKMNENLICYIQFRRLPAMAWLKWRF